MSAAASWSDLSILLPKQNFCLLLIDKVRTQEKDDVILVEVELQKPRNLSAGEREECGHGEGVGVYSTLLQSDTL